MSSYEGDSLTETMSIRKNGKRNTDLIASSAQLWRLNEIGALQLRREVGAPIPRDNAKQLLAELARAGVWEPQLRAGKA